MKRTVGCLAVVVAICFCCTAGAEAANTYTLCSVGKGKPVVSPGRSGRCGRRQHSIVLAGVNALTAAEREVHSLQALVGAQRSDIGSLQGKVMSLSDTLSGISRSGNTLLLSGMNLQIVDGAGRTDGPVNGLGNVIIGYDEHPGAQTGSHNLVIGNRQTFTSYGALVGGEGNVASAPSAAVLGNQNVARGAYSSIIGGTFNVTADPFSAVVAGCENVAGPGGPLAGSCTEGAEAVLGGFENSASGLESTVGGGEVGTASGGASSVAGGQFNVASGGGATVAGGNGNSAGGTFASILGGFENSATTFEASVAGGEVNVASGTGASVLGGHGNTASASCQAIPAAPGSC